MSKIWLRRKNLGVGEKVKSEISLYLLFLESNDIEKKLQNLLLCMIDGLYIVTWEEILTVSGWWKQAAPGAITLTGLGVSYYSHGNGFIAYVKFIP